MTAPRTSSLNPDAAAGELPRADLGRRRIVVLAEDLIWATRLLSLVRAVGATGKQAKTSGEFEREVACADAVIVDMTARSYDPIAAVERASQRGVEVVCVGQHEDLAARRRAVAAGASRVWTYNQLHTHGPTLIARWAREQLGD